MMGLGVRRIVPLTLGWVDVPKSVSVDGASGEMLREPVPAVALDCDGGWLLLDTGMNTALIRDLALRARFHSDPVEQPVLPGPEEPLPAALAAAGLDLADIRAVAISHLHYDHAGGLKHFAGRVPVHIQRAELEYGLSSPPGPEQNGIYRIDFDDPRIDWRQADGDTEIAPGVTAVRTAAHTPGHQSFVVRMAAGGGFVFAFDAADLTENIDREAAVGGRIGASAADSVEQIRKLKRIAADLGYRLVPGHDRDVWPALTAELAWLYGETLNDSVRRGDRQHRAGTQPSRGQQRVVLGVGPLQPACHDQHVQVADQHRHGHGRVGGSG
jgi:N-acyl homoserine lactone hydrolase